MDTPIDPPRALDCPGFRFYLGAPEPSWLERAGVPLFVSRRRLVRLRRRLPRASAPWALDSGAFTELTMHGRWTLDARTYVQEIRRFRDEIGRLEWAAPMDWMCEPSMLRRTGLTVREHQARTLENYLRIRQLATDVPVIPVLQGWTLEEYDRHIDDYADAGIDLTEAPLVGIGSVCRRDAAPFLVDLFGFLAFVGITAHAFGVKGDVLNQTTLELASADSMAWSYHARVTGQTCGSRVSCSNCLHAALEWRADLLRPQLRLPET